ncbi:hypothetical protein [Flavobacterium frigidarium]|uniref:hypothetical protein n=1 Tax=Flavobacterium frigidarium TaxID=99286 RepID=UPI00041CA453|nr:hypothetical protein [Flavobacterium frigidarium]
MKIAVTIILSIISQLCLGQNCICITRPELNEIISCEKTIFKNGAKIYREFNCDSSWVIFESESKKKKILFSLDKDLIELTGRLGFANWIEYKNSFIVEYHNVSGCCDPYEFKLFDKTSGKKIAELGREIYHSENQKYPYFVTIDNKNSNFLSFLNLNTNKIFKINLPNGKIENTLKITNGIFSETLFDEGQIINGVFEIKYKYMENGKDKKWLFGKITVDLKKYVS